MKKVLFVCIENSCRSQIAETFAKIHGKDVLEPYSSGSKPSGIVNPKGIASMKEIGYDLSMHRSKSLSDIPDIEYDYVITMGCGDECPFVRAKHRDGSYEKVSQEKNTSPLAKTSFFCLRSPNVSFVQPCP